MPNDPAAVRSLLKDVMLDGVVTVDKRKLLWLLGWQQDRAGAWSELLDIWVDLNQDRKTLRGCEIWGKIVLTCEEKANINQVALWAS